MFNINQTIYNVLASVSAAFTEEDWETAKSTVEGYLNTKKLRLKELADARILLEIDDEFFVARLKDELVILESELLSLEVIGKKVAENTVNAVLAGVKAIVETFLTKP